MLGLQAELTLPRLWWSKAGISCSAQPRASAPAGPALGAAHTEVFVLRVHDNQF